MLTTTDIYPLLVRYYVEGSIGVLRLTASVSVLLECRLSWLVTDGATYHVDVLGGSRLVSPDGVGGSVSVLLFVTSISAFIHI
jgi:hypothetical protein